MFRKTELVDSLNRDLARARNKRDTLASSVTTLTAQIAELEARLSAETARQARERAASVPLALASACSALGLRVGEDPAAAWVAETVIKFAQRGIRDPMELRRMTLKQFGFYE
jgi:outer membrane murein-binding lipoprotein Lpp